jgi:hypothetical protein
VELPADWTETVSVPDAIAPVNAVLAGSALPATLELPVRLGRMGVRDALPEDAEPYVRYWHHSGERIKDLLRIDRERLGGPADSRQRFLRMIRVPGTPQSSVIFTLTLNGVTIGYSNINCYTPTENFPHFHTYMHTHRDLVRRALAGLPREFAQGRGASVAPVLLGLMVQVFFRALPIQRLSLQTRPTSTGINRALDLYLPVEETRHFDKADGLAGPGVFHMRHLLRADMGRVAARTEELARHTFLATRDG